MFFESFDSMTIITLLSAVLIIVFALFSKSITWPLKLATIAVMLVVILYFLRQAGAF